jgi:putative phage-type endonuclease
MSNIIRAKLLCKQQGNTLWLNNRKLLLTASDVATVLGYNCYDTEYSLLQRKSNNIVNIILDDRAVKHGTRYESIVAKLYGDITNNMVYNTGLFQHFKYKWLGASPDGYCHIDNNKFNNISKLIEIKCPITRSIYGNIPYNYWVQVQIQLEVCNIDICDFIQVDITEVTEEEFNNLPNQSGYSILQENNINLYWKCNGITIEQINRDTEWFGSILPVLNAFWDKVIYYRSNNLDNKFDIFGKAIIVCNEVGLRRSKRCRLYQDETTYYVTDKWISMYNITNTINNDPILDWLNRWGAPKYLKDIKKNKFNNFLSQKKIEYIDYICNKIKNIHPNEHITIGCKYSILSMNKANQTVQAVIDNIPIIVNPILHDNKTCEYGIVSLLVRNDYIKSIFMNDNVILLNESNVSNYYIPVNIEYNTIKVSKSNDVLNNLQMQVCKAQLLFCNNILTKIQKYKSPYGILIGRKIRKCNKKYHNMLQECGIVRTDSAINKIIEDQIYNAKHWIHDINNNGENWDLLHPHRSELYPNMKAINSEWDTVKYSIAKQIKEITLLYRCSILQRDIAHKNQVFSYDDSNFSSDLLNLTGSNKIILDNSQSMKLQELNFYPQQISNTSVAICDDVMEFYVDFETVNDLNYDFNDTRDGIIYMIGIGYNKCSSRHNEWIYKTFVTTRLTYQSEKDIIIQWYNYMNTISNQYFKSTYKIMHWYHAERNCLNAAIKRHNLSNNYKELCWFDLHKYFSSNHIVVRDVHGYGLKDIAKQLYKFGYTTTNWIDEDINGISAILVAWDCNKYAIENNCNMVDSVDMNEIILYNEVDCKVLYDILKFIREN